MHLTFGKSIADYFPEARYYALGRHALEDVLCHEKFGHIWMPSYFCHESIPKTLRNDSRLKFYDILPTENPNIIPQRIQPSENDIVFIMNYFGLWSNNETPQLNCRIIEDHSHDLISHWAINSKADWRFASMRKSLPIPEGGILWSSSSGTLKYPVLQDSICHKDNTNRRYEAMELKSAFINGSETEGKQQYLYLFRQTEECFANLPISPIAEKTFDTINSVDVESWYEKKRLNWHLLKQYVSLPDDVTILESEKWNNGMGTPFSFVLIFESEEKRDRCRVSLIENEVYPAILWRIPCECSFQEAASFGNRMLSIHCDGRYSQYDMRELSKKINAAL